MQGSFAETKNRFDRERKQDENPKEFGQPVRSNMDSEFYDHGIDKSDAFGGVIYGNDCLRLMSNAESIFGELINFILAPNSRIDGISDHQIKQVCDKIIFFLQSLDDYIIGMLTKRFHLTD